MKIWITEALAAGFENVEIPVKTRPTEPAAGALPLTFSSAQFCGLIEVYFGVAGFNYATQLSAFNRTRPH